MIPANIDHAGIIEDLNRWGINDYKIEMICGMSKGHVHHLRSSGVQRMTYQLAARLYNFWYDERRLREPREVEGVQTVLATT